MSVDVSIHILGFITVFYIFAKVCKFAYIYLRPSSLLRYRHGSSSWALITGGSDGIGFAFAEELCQHGFNVILVGHKLQELETARATLHLRTPKAEVRILLIDAISSSSSHLENMLTTVEKLNITILINNVGGLPIMEAEVKPIKDYSIQEIDDIIYLNNRFMAQLTRLLLPVLARNGPSLVINMSSDSDMGLPYQVLYSAAKAFVVSFSSALSCECRAEELLVEVLAITPGNVNSGSNPRPLSWNTPSSRTFAKAALGMIGCGQLVVAGYWRHAIRTKILRSLPIWARQRIMIANVRSLKAMAKKQTEGGMGLKDSST